jgi:four helix bundle protein
VRSEFRDLAAYQRSADLADELRELIAAWPPDDRWSLGRQLMRSIDSIGANIAEATGRFHPRDQTRFLYIARGSLLETEHWIATAERRGLLREDTTARLTGIARPLSGLIKKRAPG